MIYDDYIEYTKTYQNKYGINTVILMEVGSFFELYAVDNDREKEGADIYTVCEICNIQVSRKNKTITENNRSNPLMAGFPSYSLNKHTQLLLANQYTIVIVRQVTQPPNPKREITEILSPSMQLTPSGIDGNYLMVMYWEISEDKLNGRHLSVGITGVDVSIGSTWVYEISSFNKDTNFAIDELIRCYQIYQPREIVILGKDLNKEERDLVQDTIGVSYDKTRSFHLYWDIDINIYKKLVYQNEVLSKAYKNNGMLSPLEALNIDKYDLVRISFTYMVQFSYEHDNNIITMLKYPTILKYDGICVLEYNSALQLNILSNNINEKPLINLINRCGTSFGSRRFKERLLQPLCDKIIINERYDNIENMIQEKVATNIYSHLRKVLDIERMLRRMILSNFGPNNWYTFHTSIIELEKVATVIKNRNIFRNNELLVDNITELSNSYKELNIEECSKFLLNEIKGNIFVSGYSQEIDDSEIENKKFWRILESIAKYFDLKVEGCRIEHNDREGYMLVMTKKRWETLYKMLDNEFKIEEIKFKKIDFEAKPISSSSSVVKVRSKYIDDLSDKIIKTANILNSIVSKKYKEYMSKYVATFQTLIQNIIDDISEIDIICTCARNAIDFNYKRPSFKCNNDDKMVNKSSLIATKMRHPILEQISNTQSYVPNDITLGDNDSQGMLLFGINASGKSSLMKSIGINIILAQAGMFVASETFEYEPYAHIFTRITTSDNIYRGWSTFTVEMMELRNILRRCDVNSLVLGDELCAGTENISALAIVASGIEYLVSKGSSFVFATHLHDLYKLSCIKKLTTVKSKHMHVEFVNGKIIYDRHLRDGQGSALYGLEVCKGLSLPSTFLHTAHQIRSEVEGITELLVGTKTSRYNSKVFMTSCYICKGPAKETHHITEQQYADVNGFINNMHKNSSGNLLVLCEECHDKIHSGKINVNGYKQTSEGLELNIDNNNQKNVATFLKNENIEKEIPNYKIIKESIKCDSKENWYYKKTKRSKWKDVDISFIKSKLISFSIDLELLNEIEKEELKYQLCDISL